MESIRLNRQGPVEKAEGQGKLLDNSDAAGQDALTEWWSGQDFSRLKEPFDKIDRGMCEWWEVGRGAGAMLSGEVMWGNEAGEVIRAKNW